MMTLQLEDFALTRLFVVWHGLEGESGKGQISVRNKYRIDYDVKDNPEDEHTLLLVMRYEMLPAETKAAYEIQAEIVGLFRFPDQLNNEEKQLLVRINGCAILYGILRGALATAMGLFPGGKAVLPAVHMPEIVADVEKARLEASKRPSRIRTKTKKGSLK